MLSRPYVLICTGCNREFAWSNRRVKLCESCKRERLIIKRKIQRYTSTFYRNRKIVFQRDNHRCRCCNSPKSNFGRSLLIHHIDLQKFNNSFSNLITLCSRCHLTLHKCFSPSELRKGIMEVLFEQVRIKSKSMDNLHEENFLKKKNRKVRKPKLFKGIKK